MLQDSHEGQQLLEGKCIKNKKSDSAFSPKALLNNQQGFLVLNAQALLTLFWEALPTRLRPPRSCPPG